MQVCLRNQLLVVLHNRHVAPVVVLVILPGVQLDPRAILLLVAVAVTLTAWEAFWQASTHLNALPLENVLRDLLTPP